MPLDGPRAAKPFAPCALIPIYNHGSTITATVAALHAHGLPVLIVDDGSDEATRHILGTLHDVRVIRQSSNQGKGRALTVGLLAAHAAGYTHALQIDADGQHAVADIPRFIDEARAHPSALVCGRPVYDHSVPRARLYGRYLTHVCVWVETLSFALRDSMCGFRVYPLAATTAQIAKRAPLPRMDFDTDIAVRLIWRGLQVVNLPTRVTYPEHGLSHFRMWEDNIRITRMHTLLLLGMLPRMPALLWRKWIKVA